MGDAVGCGVKCVYVWACVWVSEKGGGAKKWKLLVLLLLLLLPYYYYMITLTYLLQYYNFTTVLKHYYGTKTGEHIAQWTPASQRAMWIVYACLGGSHIMILCRHNGS